MFSAGSTINENGFIYLNPLKKGKILQSRRGVNSILTTILRFLKPFLRF